MPLLSHVLASSALALTSLLVGAPAPVDALVNPLSSGSGLGHIAARHLAGVSYNHNAFARRKRDTRKRCVKRPDGSPYIPPPAQQTDGGNNSGGNNSGGNNSGGNNSGTTTSVGNDSGYTTTSTPAPAQTTLPPVSNNGGGKLILAWPNGGEPSVPKYFTGNAKYYYTWSPHKVDGNTGSVKFCPMLWGYNQIGDFQNLVKPGYADCVLGMNEPNQHDQSTMNPWQGADLWNQYIGPLASQGYTILGSPAPTSAPDGLVWVQQWLGLIGVQPNVICVHWYDTTFENFQQYVTKFHEGTGYRTIWVTEFACQNFNGGAQCSTGEIWSFVQQATRWMGATDWIGAYGPFGFMRDMVNVNYENRLMNEDGSPTDLGNYFIYSA